MKTFLSGFHHLQAFFLPWPNFLLLFFSCSICFQFCLSLRGNKNILVSRGRVQDLFLSRRLSFFVPRENFCPEGRPILSFSGERKTKFEWTGKTQNGPARRTKILPRDKKTQPEGQKLILYPPEGYQNVFVSSQRQTKLKTNWAAEKKEQKIHWPRQKYACKWWKPERSVFVRLFLFSSATSCFKLRESWKQSFILILTLSSRSSFFWPGYFSF